MIVRDISPADNVRSALPVRPKSIPRELRDLPRWIAWSFEARGAKKPAKVPISARTSGRADVTNPRHLVGFDDAIAFCRAKQLAGVGFSFLHSDPYSGVDLDDCRDPGSGDLDPFAAGVVADLQTYVEVSPSGRGVKAVLRGKIDPSGRKRSGGVELYSESRYFAITGQRLPGSPRTIEDRGEVLRRLQASLAPPVPPRSAVVMPSGGFDGADAELLERAFAAKNGSRVRRLWDGQHGKPSHSEALLGLAVSLAFWVGSDASRLESLLVGSPLFSLAEGERSKWNSRRRGGSWGRRYIVEKAISTCPAFYSPPSLLKSTPTCVFIGLPRALREADAGPPAPGVELLKTRFSSSTATLRRFATFTWVLAGRVFGGRFHLAVEAAGRVFGVNAATVSQWLSTLRARGFVQRSRKGSSFTKRASEFEWLGPPADSHLPVSSVAPEWEGHCSPASGSPVAETCLPSEVPNDR